MMHSSPKKEIPMHNVKLTYVHTTITKSPSFVLSLMPKKKKFKEFWLSITI